MNNTKNQYVDHNFLTLNIFNPCCCVPLFPLNFIDPSFMTSGSALLFPQNFINPSFMTSGSVPLFPLNIVNLCILSADTFPLFPLNFINPCVLSNCFPLNLTPNVSCK